MKIRRFIAAVLAVLALSAFAGCKKHDKDQTDTTEKNDETVSEDSSESTASVADVNADIKTSRYFLGIDLDGWHHWNKVGDGFQDGLKYTALRKRNITTRRYSIVRSYTSRFHPETITKIGGCSPIRITATAR